MMSAFITPRRVRQGHAEALMILKTVSPLYSSKL